MCVFSEFIKGVIHFLFKALEHIHNFCFEVLFYASAILHFSGCTAVGLLGAGRDILSDC